MCGGGVSGAGVTVSGEVVRDARPPGVLSHAAEERRQPTGAAKRSPLGDVFVYLRQEGPHATLPAAPRTAETITLTGDALRPQVIGVRTGQPLRVQGNSFPIRLEAQRNRPRTLAAASESGRPVVLERTESAIPLRSVTDQRVLGWCFVLDHPWFALTDASGQFAISDVPAGRYTLTAWHASLGQQTLAIEVAQQPIKDLRVRFVAPLQPLFRLRPGKSTIIELTPRRALPGGSPRRTVVRHWTLPDFPEVPEQVLAGKNIARGQKVFELAKCTPCHRGDDVPATYGPPLKDLRRRFRGRALLAEILDPSRNIHPDYPLHQLVLEDGRAKLGLIAEETPRAIRLVANPSFPQATEVVPKAQIEHQVRARVSFMPAGMLDTFTRDEILDLLAFLEAQ